jgi:inosine/xanthosine triphosphatase
MKINIGSKNKAKINALKEILKEYPDFEDAEVFDKDVDSEVSHHPRSLEETIAGAINRAKNSFTDCDFSVGLESGLMKVPQTKTGYMDTTVCAIYDGKNFNLGLSSCFEFPPKVLEYMFAKNENASNAFRELGLTDKEYIGYEEGIIGVVTKNRLDRKEYTKQAIRTALIHLENKELYGIQ